MYDIQLNLTLSFYHENWLYFYQNYLRFLTMKTDISYQINWGLLWRPIKFVPKLKKSSCHENWYFYQNWNIGTIRCTLLKMSYIPKSTEFVPQPLKTEDQCHNFLKKSLKSILYEASTNEFVQIKRTRILTFKTTLHRNKEPQ